MEATLRKVRVLMGKDLADLVKNPSMLISLALPVGFSLVTRYALANASDQVAAAATSAAALSRADQVLRTFTLTSALAMAIGMVVGMTVVYGIAEEKEKHTLRTLMLANVSVGEIVASRALVALGATLAVATASFFVVGTAGVELLPAYLAVGALGALPIILISLVFGLASRDQMTAGFYSVPVVLISLAPIFGMYNEGASSVVRWLPTGGMNELMGLLVEGRLMSLDALLPLGVTLAWTVAGGAVFAALFRRLIRDN